MQQQFFHLLTGHDTIECAYYLKPDWGNALDYELLAAQREDLRRTKTRFKSIKLGSEEFLFACHGTKSGFPFLIENDTFSIQFGEFNKPNFFVTFSRHALWHNGLTPLHDRFIAWAESVGLRPYQMECLSRVDFTFDYHLPEIDFDEDNFVSRSTKDAQHRKGGKVQTFQFGKGDIRLRIYNKCDEIQEHSAKTWLYNIWQIDNGVWRIEWQIRKQELRSMGISDIESLYARQVDLLHKLVNQHTTLRIKSSDSNTSRWLWHPLWEDLDMQVSTMEQFGTYRSFDYQASIDEQLIRLSSSVYGYMKRLAAIICRRDHKDDISIDDAIDHLRGQISKIYEEQTWNSDVRKRLKEMSLSPW